MIYNYEIATNNKFAQANTNKKQAITYMTTKK
jgi:hypothetical protein